jgi:hypothetical protein
MTVLLAEPPQLTKAVPLSRDPSDSTGPAQPDARWTPEDPLVMITAGRRLLALASVGLIGLAACGGGGGDGSQKVATLGASDPSTSTGGGGASGGGSSSGTDAQTRQKAFLAYAQCMRDNGVDMKDPTFDANGRPQFRNGAGGFFGSQANRDDPVFQKAQQACRSKLQGLQGRFNLDPAQQAQLRKNLLAFAQCMRDHGVDMKDPTFDANGRPQFGGNGPGGPEGAAQRNDPTYQKAFQACQSKIGSFRPGGPAAGGSGSTTTTPGGGA